MVGQTYSSTGGWDGRGGAGRGGAGWGGGQGNTLDAFLRFRAEGAYERFKGRTSSATTSVSSEIGYFP